MEIERYGNGQIVFISKVDDRPATSRTEGNVTINEAAVEGHPEHFVVDFNITATSKVGAVAHARRLSLSVPVPGRGRDARYDEVENEAAHMIPAVLRQIADLVEAQNAAVDDKSSD